MAFMANLFTAGITVSVAYRGAHALHAFSNDVGAARAQAELMNAELARTRQMLVRWGGASLISYGMLKGFDTLIDKASKLETAIAGIQARTAASSSEMEIFTERLMKAASRTEFPTSDIAKYTDIFVSRMPTSFQGDKFKNVLDIIAPLSEFATLLHRMPSKQFNPEAVYGTLSSIVARYVPEENRTGEKMLPVIRLATAAMEKFAFEKPEEMTRLLSYFQKGIFDAPMSEQLAFISNLKGGGAISGRTASTPGRTINEVLEIMLPTDTELKALKQRRGASSFNMNSLMGFGAGGSASAFDKNAFMQSRLGIADYAQKVMQDKVQFSITELVRIMREKASTMSKEELGQTLSHLSIQSQRMFGYILDPAQDFAKAMEQTTKLLYDSALPGRLERSNDAFLSRYEGARDMLLSNVEDVASLLGQGLLPANTAFYLKLNEGVQGLRDFVLANGEATKWAVKFAAALTGATFAATTYMLGSAAGAYLGNAAAIIGGGALMRFGARALPLLGGGIGATIALPMLMPLISEIWNAATGYKGEKDKDAWLKDDKEGMRAELFNLATKAGYGDIAEKFKSAPFEAFGELYHQMVDRNTGRKGSGAVGGPNAPYSEIPGASSKPEVFNQSGGVYEDNSFEARNNRFLKNLGAGSPAAGEFIKNFGSASASPDLKNSAGGITSPSDLAGGMGGGFGSEVPMGKFLTIGPNGIQDVTKNFQMWSQGFEAAGGGLGAGLDGVDANTAALDKNSGYLDTLSGALSDVLTLQDINKWPSMMPGGGAGGSGYDFATRNLYGWETPDDSIQFKAGLRNYITDRQNKVREAEKQSEETLTPFGKFLHLFFGAGREPGINAIDKVFTSPGYNIDKELENADAARKLGINLKDLITLGIPDLAEATVAAVNPWIFNQANASTNIPVVRSPNVGGSGSVGVGGGAKEEIWNDPTQQAIAESMHPQVGMGKQKVVLSVDGKELNAELAEWNSAMLDYQTQRGSRTTATNKGYSGVTPTASRRSR